jgi:hypothetical protein
LFDDAADAKITPMMLQTPVTIETIMLSIRKTPPAV